MFLSSLQNTKRPRCMRGSRNRLPAGCGLSPHPLHAEPRMPVTTAKASRPLAPFFHGLPKLGRLSQTFPRQLRFLEASSKRFFIASENSEELPNVFSVAPDLRRSFPKVFPALPHFRRSCRNVFPATPNSRRSFPDVPAELPSFRTCLRDVSPVPAKRQPILQTKALPPAPVRRVGRAKGAVESSPGPASLGERRPGTTNAPELLP